MLKYFVLVALQISIGSCRCYYTNPKNGEIQPSIELEIITKSTAVPKKDLNVTIRCIARAPVHEQGFYNPYLLLPKTINFFFNGNFLQSQNCPHGGETSEKVCDLVIPKFDARNAGKYYCQARNGYLCTVMHVDITQFGCAGGN